MRPARGVAALVSVAILALGCATSFHDEYQAQHPGWVAMLPKAGMPLDELLAALHAESPVDTIAVEPRRIDVVWRSDEGEDGWASTPFEALRPRLGELHPAADTLVIAAMSCRFNPGIESRTLERWALYLLPGGRLQAWDHTDFRDGCASSTQYVPARGETIAMEREAIRKLRRLGGRVDVDLAEAYRRGFALVEAGRLEDARAMLVVGERMRRALLARVADAPMAVADTDRAREKLMRVLGLEPVSAGPQ